MHKLTVKKAERVGWLRYNMSGRKNIFFNDTIDAVIRIFYAEHYGFVAAVNIPGKAPQAFHVGIGVGVETLVRKVVSELRNDFTANKEGFLFNFQASDVRDFATQQLEVQFETANDLHIHKAGSMPEFKIKKFELVSKPPKTVIEMSGGRVGTLLAAFDNLPLAKLRLT